MLDITLNRFALFTDKGDHKLELFAYANIKAMDEVLAYREQLLCSYRKFLSENVGRPVRIKKAYLNYLQQNETLDEEYDILIQKIMIELDITEHTRLDTFYEKSN